MNNKRKNIKYIISAVAVIIIAAAVLLGYYLISSDYFLKKDPAKYYLAVEKENYEANLSPRVAFWIDYANEIILDTNEIYVSLHITPGSLAAIALENEGVNLESIDIRLLCGMSDDIMLSRIKAVINDTTILDQLLSSPPEADDNDTDTIDTDTIDMDTIDTILNSISGEMIDMLVCTIIEELPVAAQEKGTLSIIPDSYTSVDDITLSCTNLKLALSENDFKAVLISALRKTSDTYPSESLTEAIDYLESVETTEEDVCIESWIDNKRKVVGRKINFVYDGSDYNINYTALPDDSGTIHFEASAYQNSSLIMNTAINAIPYGTSGSKGEESGELRCSFGSDIPISVVIEKAKGNDSINTAIIYSGIRIVNIRVNLQYNVNSVDDMNLEGTAENISEYFDNFDYEAFLTEIYNLTGIDLNSYSNYIDNFQV